MTSELTHINEQGHARMVDISDKDITQRTACAAGTISMNRETFDAVLHHTAAKGDVLAAAQVAGIMAAKHTSDAIPMCHSLMLTGVDIQYQLYPETCEIQAAATVKTTGKTGVEMEALHAVSIALLTIYDMCKAMDRSMTIHTIRLLEKEGGKSGHYVRNEKD